MSENRSTIVTGGAGFIGSNIVAALNARGVDDIVIVDHADSEARRRNIVDLCYRELVDKMTFRKRVLSGQEPAAKAVLHMGACSSTTEMDLAYLNDNNYQYTRDLCTWALETGARFVYASSAATYGDGALGYSDSDDNTPGYQPLNPYGQSKQKFDLWALKNGLLDSVVGLKYFNVYGPREDHKGAMRSMVNKAYGQVLETEKLQLFRSHHPDFADGEQDRDFIYIDDAVAVSLFFMDHPEINGLFNCGTGQARTWNDLAAALFAAMDRPVSIEYVDMPAAIRDRYQYHTEADLTKLRAAGYDEPFLSIEDGVKRYVESWLGREAGSPPARR